MRFKNGDMHLEIEGLLILQVLLLMIATWCFSTDQAGLGIQIVAAAVGGSVTGALLGKKQ